MGNSKNLTFFDTFSGIGGFKLGLERAGFKSIGFCDNDKYANALYKAYFQNYEEVFYDDIRTINTAELPDFDIICGGFPCQAFSIAGKRQGFKDSRGDLFFELVRILKDKRPRYFLFENVKGLLNHNDRKTFIAVIKELTNLGYRVQWQVLNSKFFSVPQNRERVYIVGCLGDECIGKIFPLASDSSENPRSILVHPLSIKKSQGDRVYSTEGISSCLTSNGGGLGGKTGLYFINKPRFDKYKPSNVVETLKVGGDTPLVAIPVLTPERIKKRQNGRRFKENQEAMFTLTGQDIHGIYDGSRVRKLTPLECFRLQAFPDDMISTARELNLKDGQLYKMAGNAVTVNVVEAVAKKLWGVANEFRAA